MKIGIQFSIPYGLTLPSNMANIGKYLLGNKFLGKHAQELIHYWKAIPRTRKNPIMYQNMNLLYKVMDSFGM